MSNRFHITDCYYLVGILLLLPGCQKVPEQPEPTNQATSQVYKKAAIDKFCEEYATLRR